MTRDVTVGIDLASVPKRTGVCAIEWPRGQLLVCARGRVRAGTAWVALDDAFLCRLMRGQHPDVPAPVKVAIDAPFGWPAPFVAAVSAHNAQQGWPVALDGDRRQLTHRLTDRLVEQRTPLLGVGGTSLGRGKRPLSVSADQIAMPAMRCAGLLAALGAPRDGSGVACEVYPDAALRHWGLWDPEWDAAHVGYKGTATDAASRRRELVGRFAEAMRAIVDLGEHRDACERYDDVFDAVVSAVVARAAALEATIRPHSQDERRAAQTEGWIDLPTPDCLLRLREAGVR